MAGEKSGSAGMKKFYALLGLVAVAGAVAVWYGTRGGGAGAVEPVELGEMEDQEILERASVATAGQPDAAYTIVEFGDYQCPSCRYFATSVKTLIDLTYVETGIAKFEYRDFPLDQHQHAFLAARASWCADDQGQYWPYHDALFRAQRDWSVAGNAARHFNRLARELGLDAGDFSSCLDSDRHADAVTASVMLGQRMGIGGTPTVVVKPPEGAWLVLSGADFAQIQAVIEGGPEG